MKNNDCFLAAEKIEITCNMLSNYCSTIADVCNIKVGSVKKT